MVGDRARKKRSHPNTCQDKMLKTFTLSALFFLSLGLVAASYAQLPLA